MDSIKKILVVVLICIFEISAMAKESNADDKSLDFSITLKALNKLILEEYDSNLLKKIVILDGKINTIEYLNNSFEQFSVILELVKGEWIGLDEIATYRCLILFEGSQFVENFNYEEQSNSNLTHITPKSRVIVAGKIRQKVELDSDTLIWLVDGLYIRKI